MLPLSVLEVAISQLASPPPLENMSTVTYDSNTPPLEPCTACKYQGRQCNSDCQLVPYFPANKQRQFINAHRLFGVCNILKILRKVGPSQQAEAMRSIIFESDVWAQVPNGHGGCYHLILTLDQYHQHLTNELALTNQQIQYHRSQQQQQEKENAVVDVKPMVVESGPGNGVRRLNYFVASLSLRVLLLLCSVTGLVLLLTGNGTDQRFPPSFVSLLDTEFSHSLALVCFLVVVSVACLYSLVTILASFSVISIPSLPPRLLYLPTLCNNPQFLRELKVSDRHQDSVSKRSCCDDGDLEEGLKKQKWVGEDENKEEMRENGKM